MNGLGGNRNKAIDHAVINQRLTGLAEKFFVKGQGTKGEALESFLQRLRGKARSLGGGDSARAIIASSEMALEQAAQNVLSSVLLVLLELSESPTALKRGEENYTVPEALKEKKGVIKTQEEADRELLRAILKDDPLVGEHWKFPKDDDDEESDGSDFEDSTSNRIARNTKDTASAACDVTAPAEGDTIPILHGSDLWRQLSRERSHVLAPLKALERHQYWRGNSIISRRGTTEPRKSKCEYDIQCSTGLNAALRSSSEFILPQSTPIMHELDVINEILLLLQGLPTVIFTLENGVAKVPSVSNTNCGR